MKTQETFDLQPSPQPNQEDYFDPLTFRQSPVQTRKRRYDDMEREDELRVANIDDSFEAFGKFVASELRQIGDLRVAKRIQRQLNYRLLEFLDELDNEKTVKNETVE